MKILQYFSIGAAVYAAVVTLIAMLRSGVYDADSIWSVIAPVLASINAATKANIDMALAEGIVDDAVIVIKAKYAKG